MNIVVTDGFTVSGIDLSWDMISHLGDISVYERTPLEVIIERCKEADIILTNKTPFNRQTLAALPNLKCISVLATGYNVIDTVAAKEQGIVVCNLPGYSTASVAQQVFALLLELTNAVGLHNQSVKQGGWQQSADWAYTLHPTMELSGKTMGIIGFGTIGQQVGKIADAFNMNVIFYNPRQKSGSIGQQVSLETVFSESDAVSLHCPLTIENRGLVNASLMQRMKPTAYLINTARGPLIQEDDLAFALNEGIIAGAALDVLSTEPPTDKQLALIKARNCIITPHNAWMTKEARMRVLTMTKANLEAFMQGQPINQVN